MSQESPFLNKALEFVPKECPSVVIGTDKLDQIPLVDLTEIFDSVMIAKAKCKSGDPRNFTCKYCPLASGQTINLNTS